MLVELSIQDLALIERAELSFGAGLNVITGETGAGKSLLIDALELLLGQRGRTGLVRKGADRARVEGVFLLSRGGYGAEVEGWLEEHLPQALEEAAAGEPDLELILTRTVGRDGRSRAQVNHRPVTQKVLRELAARLVEIHGQFEGQKLFEATEQGRLLDAFGELESTLHGYQERRDRWRELAMRLEAFEQEQADRAGRLDMLRFQVRELEEAQPPQDDDQGSLLSERERLRHAGELGTELGAVVDDLSEREGAALDVVRRAERVVEDWEGRLPELSTAAEALRESTAHLEVAAQSLASMLDGVEVDPVRLEDLEGRLGEWDRLARKHGCEVSELSKRLEAATNEAAELEEADVGRDELSVEVEKARASTQQAAGRLTKGRKRLVKKLCKEVEAGLADLGLERASFDVALVDKNELGPRGAEEVEFRLAANPGEEAGPLSRVASGGEAARILLALRGALAVRQSTPTLIFDEVDAGVGGRLGPRVGAHLTDLGKHHQIFCVTHLPAIAAGADRHLKVEKAVEGGRTRTHVTHLTGDGRVEEIADMIAGGADQATALAEARRLLESGPLET